MKARRALSKDVIDFTVVIDVSYSTTSITLLRLLAILDKLIDKEDTQISKLSEEEQTWRLELMKEALEILTNNCSGLIYVDVGHSNWLDPKVVCELLNKVSNPKVKGFSVNSCNYRTTKEAIRWSRKVLKGRENDNFVIDTSRNGNGPADNEWCNPSGRALGEIPTCETSHNRCDAYLWVKIPGESDGKCNGGPKAGMFWGEQAEELVKNFTKNLDN